MSLIEEAVNAHAVWKLVFEQEQKNRKSLHLLTEKLDHKQFQEYLARTGGVGYQKHQD